jgi:hypothetical protein
MTGFCSTRPRAMHHAKNVDSEALVLLAVGTSMQETAEGI